MCGFFWQSNLICFLLNQRAHIFYKNSLFYLFIFLFSYLLNSAADHNIFIYQFSKTPSRKKKNKQKTHIPTPYNPLMILSAKFGMYFHTNLGLCTALLHNHFHLRFEHIGRTRAFLSFILSFPPLESDGHMAGTLPGFSNNRRDLISIPTSCHQ